MPPSVQAPAPDLKTYRAARGRQGSCSSRSQSLPASAEEIGTVIPCFVANENGFRTNTIRPLDVFTACADELGLPFTVATFAERITAVQAAKEDCKLAREAWEAHLQLHGCDKPERAPKGPDEHRPRWTRSSCAFLTSQNFGTVIWNPATMRQ